MSTPSPSFDSVSPIGGYSVELLMSEFRPLDIEVLRTTLGKLAPTAELSGQDGRASITFTGETSSTYEIGQTTEGIHDVENVQNAFSQTWDWPQAEHALSHVMASLSVREPSTSPLADRYERTRRLNIVLRALLEHLPVSVIVWTPSQRLVDPNGFIESLAHGGSITDHAVNVRLFRIPDGRPGETLMDTIGLNHFGLADLQCHFAGLDPSDVAPLLLQYAEYVFEKGDVLKDDDLIRGIESHDEWTCHREESLALPARVVVDIRPDKYGVTH